MITTPTSIKSLDKKYTKSNLNTSNIDGLFTMAYSNSFLRPYEILPITQEDEYLRNFFKEFFFYYEIVCCVYSFELPYW